MTRSLNAMVTTPTVTGEASIPSDNPKAIQRLYTMGLVLYICEVATLIAQWLRSSRLTTARSLATTSRPYPWRKTVFL